MYPFQKIHQQLILTHHCSFSYWCIYIWSIHLLIQMSPSHGLHLIFIYFIFSRDFYLMLERLRFHVFHWFLFNERHWFALIGCSLITMKLTVSLCVHHGCSTGEPAHKLVNCEEMDKENLNKPCGISFVRHLFFLGSVPPRGLKHKYVQLCAHACISAYMNCRQYILF